MRSICYGLLAFLFILIVGFVVVTVTHMCPRGESYQVVKYVPLFDRKGRVRYEPIHGCK
jgi:hypothetical protein